MKKWEIEMTYLDQNEVTQIYRVEIPRSRPGEAIKKALLDAPDQVLRTVDVIKAWER